VVILFVVEYAHGKRDLIKASEHLPVAGRWFLYFLLVFLILFYGSFGVENFIYIQF